jgi:hypothetical protein
MMMTPLDINRLGYRALVKELGFDGMVRFLHQFNLGEGDYTQERRQWLDDLSIDDVFAMIETQSEGRDRTPNL